MKLIWMIILKVVGIIFRFKFKSEEDGKIQRDSDLADKIRNGDGQGIAEEFKKRKQYE